MNLTLARRRNAPAPPEVGTVEIARALALDAVDATLQQVCSRKRFIRSEASGLLTDLRAELDEIALGAGTTETLDGAVVSLGSDTVVDGRRVVDTLLDIRLAVARGGR
jgi:hypothetical protein